MGTTLTRSWEVGVHRTPSILQGTDGAQRIRRGEWIQDEGGGMGGEDGDGDGRTVADILGGVLRGPAGTEEEDGPEGVPFEPFEPFDGEDWGFGDGIFTEPLALAFAFKTL